MTSTDSATAGWRAALDEIGRQVDAIETVRRDGAWQEPPIPRGPIVMPADPLPPELREQADVALGRLRRLERQLTDELVATRTSLAELEPRRTAARGYRQIPDPRPSH